MENLGDIIKKLPQRAAQSIDIKSPHGEQIVKIMEFMGENPHDHRRYRYWCGRTRHLDVGQMFRMRMQASREGKNPQKLFNWLLKQSKPMKKALPSKSKKQ